MGLINFKKNTSIIAFIIGFIIFELIFIKQYAFTIFRFSLNTVHIEDNLELLELCLFILICILILLCVINVRLSNWLIFFVIPYILSVITWSYTNYIPDYHFYKKLGLYGQFEALFIVSYIIYGVWVITVIAYLSNYLMNKLLTK